jgi:hypothetical protein
MTQRFSTIVLSPLYPTPTNTLIYRWIGRPSATILHHNLVKDPTTGGGVMEVDSESVRDVHSETVIRQTLNSSTLLEAIFRHVLPGAHLRDKPAVGSRFRGCGGSS